MPAKPPRLTQAQGLKAVAWAKERLGLQGWSITLDITDDRPAGVEPGAIGLCEVAAARKSADIWVGPTANLVDNSAVINTLFHEVAHAALVEAGIPAELQDWRTDHLCDLVSELMSDAYTP